MDLVALSELSIAGINKPGEQWLEVRNLSAIEAIVNVRAAQFAIHAKPTHADPYPLGFARLIEHLEPINVSAEKKGHRGTFVPLKKKEKLALPFNKPERLKLLDWCGQCLENSRNLSIFAHSALEYHSQFEAYTEGVWLEALNSWLLPPNATLWICLVAVADLWGEYSDQLQVAVQPFDLKTGLVEYAFEEHETSIPMLVKVTGTPLEFTIMSNMTNDITDPSLRFGCHVMGAKPTKKRLRIMNHCSLQMSIFWQVYLQQHEQRLVDAVFYFGEPCTRNEEFGAPPVDYLEDIFGDTPNPLPRIVKLQMRAHQGNLLERNPRSTTSEDANLRYSQTQNLPRGLLRVEPQVLQIAAHGEAEVEVEFDPKADEEFNRRNICSKSYTGKVVGLLRPRLKEQPRDVVRGNELEIDKLTVHLSCSIERPCVDFDFDDSDEEDVDRTLHFRAALSSFLVKVESPSRASRVSSTSQAER
ncbi:hypothetical protein Ciccas_007212 [Cichlidogyrus casuarinus]|uniref:Uncharacterized protein n=1 Tax=Cichlidogyrus casuarinus TaxID=1844966 RepID=A0ABD2Q459_9PLAT